MGFRLFAVPCLVLGLLLAGVPAAAQTERASVEHTVRMTDYKWTPGELTILAGDTVLYVNEGDERHYVLEYGKDAGFWIDPGQSVRMRYSEPGSRAIYCDAHGAIYAGKVLGNENIVLHVRHPDDTGRNDPPRVQITRPGNGTLMYGVASIEGLVVDPDGPKDLARVALRVDGGPWTDLESESMDGALRFLHRLNATALGPGGHVLEVRAMDLSFARHTATLTFSVPETPPPTGVYGNALPAVRIESPLARATLWDPHVARGSARDPDSGVLLVELRVDDGPWIPGNGTGVWHFSLFPARLGPGAHRLEVRAFDGLDHSAVAGVAFTVKAPRGTAQAAVAPTGGADERDDAPSPGLVGLLAALGAVALMRRRRR